MTNLITISDARANLPSLINKVGEGIERFLITVNNQPKAILLSVEELESLEETAEIMATSGVYESIKKSAEEIRKGRYITLEELKKKYK